MSKKNILLAITNGLWLMDVQSAEQLGHNVASVLAGEKFWNEKHKSNAEVIIAEPSGSHFSNSFSSAKAGSIAIIPISGPIMKDDNCGDPGTKTYEDLIKQASLNPNITGIVLQIDSPGGTVSGTQSLSDLIKSIDKPVVTLAEDLMASAGYWIGSSADYIFANTGTTRIGSIGTMISFSDMQPVWEEMGVKFHEIYATASTAKNKDFAEARKGNYDNIKQNLLDPLNNEFMNSVKANRGDKLNAEKTLNGQVYTANDALKYGLIDGIGNINDAINKVIELASGVETPLATAKTENQINMKKITLLASQAAMIALCGASISAGEPSVEVELTEELIEKMNAALVAGETAKTALTAAAEKATAQATSITDLTAKLDVANAKITSLETAGATAPIITATTEKVTETVEESFRTEADDHLAAAKQKIYGKA